MKTFVFIVFMSLFFLSFVNAQDQPPAGKLPGDVRPLSYELSLIVVPTQQDFSGSVKIAIDITRELSGFWIDGKEIRPKHSTLTLANGESMDVTYKQVNDDGLVWIGLPKAVTPQQAMLAIDYDAPFNRTLNGLYRVDAGSESYAFTQFENINARLCFPSFDEPGFKTPYDITVTARKTDSVITNTLPDHEEQLDNGMKRIHFARTPKLPTYLVAFVVGPLDIVNGKDIPADEIRKTPIPLRVITIQGKGSQAAYALKTAPGILQALERYFGIPYPYAKLDLIAVPDFEAGAMENAATITFREWALLLDEANSPERQRRYYEITMAHEMAHQWFGDLVTMSWWDDVWLNESFATWVSERIIQKWDPTAHETTSAVQDARGVLDIDSMVAARQIRQPINNTSDIDIAINWITYAKGGAVIAMFEKYVGEETFRKGIQLYIKKYENSNATTDDFLNALSEVAQKDIGGPFRTFLFQPGVPLVDTRISCEGGKTELALKQQRYLPLGSKANPNQVWQFPVCLKYGVDGKVVENCTMLTKAEDTVSLDTNGKCPEWVLPNADGAGYYRFSLTSDEYAHVEKALDQLSVVEQIALLDSLRSGFRSGRLAAADVLPAMKKFAASKSEEVARSPIEFIDYVHDYVVPRSMASSVEVYARDTYRPVLDRVGFDRNPKAQDDPKALRSDVIPLLAFTARDPQIRAEAKRRGIAYVGYGTDGKIHRDAVDVNLVSVCLGVAVQEGDTAFFDNLVGILKQSTDPVLRGQLIGALGRSTDPARVKKTLDLTLDPAIYSNEIATVLASVADEVVNREPMWNWLKQNMEPLSARLSLESRMYVPFVAARFCSAQAAKDVESFFGPMLSKFPAGKLILSGTLERIALCDATVQAQQPGAIAYFQKAQPAAAAK